MAGGGQDGADGLAVEAAGAGFGLEQAGGFFGRPGGALGARLGEGGIDIGGG